MEIFNAMKSMNKKILFLSLFSLGLCSGLSSFCYSAEVPDEEGPPPPPGHMMRGGHGGPMGHLMNGVDLTAEQKEKVRSIMETHRKQAHKDIEAILTKEQKIKFRENLAEMEQKMKERKNKQNDGKEGGEWRDKKPPVQEDE